MKSQLPLLRGRSGLPVVAPEVFRTEAGTPYLKEAGVAMISRPHVDLSGVSHFLDGFDGSLGFADYLDDPTELPPAEALVKFAGQLCYLSHGPGRSTNADCGAYLDNIKKSGHGSVTEHANFSFLIWGIDRSVTHELVRHRAGFGFSQCSQRYVDGTRLRFVERPEYQEDRCPSGVHSAFYELRDEVKAMHADFVASVDRARAHYDATASRLMRARELGHPMLQGGAKTEARKQVNQVARESLPNSAEAPIVVTGNVRALRHAIEMRANQAADVPIRELAMKLYRCLADAAPVLFGDYEVVPLPTSSTEAIRTATRKI